MNKKEAVLKLMRKQWVSPQIALEKCGLMSLAQQVSKIKAERASMMRWGLVDPKRLPPEIESRWEEKNGSRYKSYHIVG